MERPGRARIFKTRWFERFARKQKIGDSALLDAIERAEKGQPDADLGGEVIKQRIARPGKASRAATGPSFFFRRGARAVFAYGFAKSDRANIVAAEEKQFKEAARHVLQLTEKQIAELLKNGDFVEVKDEQEISK